VKRLHTQAFERLLTFSLTLSLGLPLVSTPALAIASAQDPGADDARLAEAQRLYKLGEARFELFDFPAAIEFWTEAYGLLPEGENARVRNVLVRNLSVAHIKAFDVDSDVKHLKTAKLLLEKYVAELTTYYEGEAETAHEIGEANNTLAEIDAKLETIRKKEEAEAAAATPPPSTGDPDPTSEPTTDDPPPPQVDEDGLRKGKLLMGIGGGMLGVAAAGAGIGITGAVLGDQASLDSEVVDPVDRPEQIDKGRKGNALAWTGIAVGGTFLIAGVALVIVGAKKKKAAKTAALRPRFSPQLSRTGAGASLSMEF
jgi:hypothetical protein